MSTGTEYKKFSEFVDELEATSDFSSNNYAVLQDKKLPANLLATAAALTEETEARETLDESSVKKSIGANLCDSSLATHGFYNGKGFYTADSYLTSDYIEVNEQNLTAKYYENSTVISSITVFDENKNYIRSIKQTPSYEYEGGDYFVRFTWEVRQNENNFISYGSEATDKDFSPIGGYLEGKYIPEGNLTLDDVENGKYTVMQTQADLPSSSAKVIVSDTEFQLKNKGTGGWLSLPDLPIDGSVYHVSFEAENQTAETYPNAECSIIVANGTSSATSGNYDWILDFKDGTYDLVVDPNYYVVHKGWTKFRVWLRYGDGNGTDYRIFDFKNFKIYKRVGEMQTSNISGSDSKELFESVDEQITDLKNSVEQFSIDVTGSNGKKYEVSIDNDGKIVGLPIIPTKAHFFGNSLLTSNGSASGSYGLFGMNATDHTLDYASRFASCVLTLNPSYTYTRHANSGFEDLTTTDEATVNALIQTKYLDNLDGDEDFVCVQLGDNGSAQAVAVLGANVETLLRAIRNKCNGARVFVFGMWYSSTAKQTALYNAATNTGCKYINMNGIRSTETESYYGAVIDEGYTGSWTVDDVVSVADNSTNNITVVFTVSDTQYTSTLDVDSYSLSGTTLTYSGTHKITTNGGVASHPGNEGFRLLANRLLYQTKIVDTEEYFTA